MKLYATGEIYQIRRDVTCTIKNVIYVAYFIVCSKQGVGSTVCWKSRLSNYKSHIKQSKHTCRIVSHFTDNCVDNNLKNL